MNDGLALYQDAIKQRAGAAHGQGALAAPDGEVRLDNPLCGDRVTLRRKAQVGDAASLSELKRTALAVVADDQAGLGGQSPSLDGVENGAERGAVA